MKNPILLLLLIITFPASSQISGIIIDSLSYEKMSYCTVVLSDSAGNVLDVNVTTNDGYFKLNTKDTTNLKLSVNFSGYKTYEKKIIKFNESLTLDTIYLAPNYNDIGEIIISKNISSYKNIADKTVVTLSEKIIKTKPNVFDALQTVSGLDVDKKTKNISVFGSDKTLILINGVVKNSIDLLDLKSKDIEKIEIITNPGAKYQAEYSGVINIVTKQILQKGFSSSLTTELYYPFIYNFTDVNFKYGFDKIQIFGVYHLFHRNSSTFEVTNTLGDEYQIIDTAYDASKRNQTQHYFKLGMDYFINSNNFMSIFANYANYAQNIPQTYNSSILKNDIIFDKTSLNKQNNFINNSKSISLYFKHNFKNDNFFDIYLTFNQTLMNSSKIAEGYLNKLSENLYYNQNNSFIYDKNSFWIFSKYKFLLSDINFELGANYYFREITQTTQIIDSSFAYFASEQRPRLYLSADKKFNKFSINADLSSEFYKTNEENKYTIFFVPSLSLSFKINNKNSISASYAKKNYYLKTRQVQSSFTYTTDSLTFYINNNNIKIPKLDRFQFSYMFMKNSSYFKTIFYYNYYKKPIQNVIYFQEPLTYYSYENIDFSYKYGVQILSSLSFFDNNLMINPSLNIYHQFYNFQNYSNLGWAFISNIYVDYYLREDLDISFNFHYETKRPEFMGYTYFKPYVDIGIGKSFFDDVLYTSLNFNPFDTYFEHEYELDNATISGFEIEHYRSLFVQISYYFSKGKLLKASRNNTIDKDF